MQKKGKGRNQLMCRSWTWDDKLKTSSLLSSFLVLAFLLFLLLLFLHSFTPVHDDLYKYLLDNSHISGTFLRVRDTEKFKKGQLMDFLRVGRTTEKEIWVSSQTNRAGRCSSRKWLCDSRQLLTALTSIMCPWGGSTQSLLIFKIKYTRMSMEQYVMCKFQSRYKARVTWGW